MARRRPSAEQPSLFGDALAQQPCVKRTQPVPEGITYRRGGTGDCWVCTQDQAKAYAAGERVPSRFPAVWVRGENYPAEMSDLPASTPLCNRHKADQEIRDQEWAQEVHKANGGGETR